MTPYSAWQAAKNLGFDWIEPIPTGWLWISYTKSKGGPKIHHCVVIEDPNAVHVLQPIEGKGWEEWAEILQRDGWITSERKNSVGMLEFYAIRQDRKIELIDGLWFYSRDLGNQEDDILDVGDCLDRIYQPPTLTQSRWAKTLGKDWGMVDGKVDWVKCYVVVNDTDYEERMEVTYDVDKFILKGKELKVEIPKDGNFFTLSTSGSEIPVAINLSEEGDGRIHEVLQFLQSNRSWQC